MALLEHYFWYRRAMVLGDQPLAVGLDHGEGHENTAVSLCITPSILPMALPDRKTAK